VCVCVRIHMFVHKKSHNSTLETDLCHASFYLAVCMSLDQCGIFCTQ